MEENTIILWFGNIFFFMFHGMIIFINLLGWIFWKLRKLHYLVLSFTLFSWFVLGIYYGWGYCFLTDWHYSILRKLGYQDLPYSYIKFCLDGIFQSNFNPFWVDVGTVLGLLVGILGASYNLFFRKEKKLQANKIRVDETKYS